MTVLDPTAAVAMWLKGEIGDQCEDRVFRPSLDRDEDTHMPRAAVVVRPAGGYNQFGGGTLKIGDPRMDIICYGETLLESQNLARAALLALKGLTPVVSEGVLLSCARISSGILPLIDPSTQWPYAVVSAQVVCSESN